MQQQLPTHPPSHTANWGGTLRGTDSHAQPKALHACRRMDTSGAACMFFCRQGRSPCWAPFLQHQQGKRDALEMTIEGHKETQTKQSLPQTTPTVGQHIHLQAAAAVGAHISIEKAAAHLHTLGLTNPATTSAKHRVPHSKQQPCDH